jgi:signal transduction histidine kinase
LSRIPVRIRLTLAFTAVMAVVLIAVGLFVYGRVGSDLDAALDSSLRSRADDLAAVAGPGRPSRRDQDRLVASDESVAQVIGSGGRVEFSSAGVGMRPLLQPDELTRARRQLLFVNRDSVAGFDERMRLLARPTDGGVVVVGATRESRAEALSSLGTVLLTGGPIALLLAALAGYWLASAALRPVGAMRREAAEVSRLGSGRRLPVPPAGDELSRLGGTLNEMLERLEKSAERERGFVASASHELRTPLALLKAELELALRKGRTAEELRAAVASAAGESDRLVQLAEDLLVLARADEGRLPVRPEALDAGELLRSTARRFEARAAGTGRELRVGPSDGVPLRADRLRAEQALANLVDNALRHGDGTVELTAERSDGVVRLHVRDRGPGFDPTLNGRAFERFTRGDRARSRGGTGLGLAIVDAIARSHGGRAGGERREGGGLDAWVELPDFSRPPHPRGIETPA